MVIHYKTLKLAGLVDNTSDDCPAFMSQGRGLQVQRMMDLHSPILLIIITTLKALEEVHLCCPNDMRSTFVVVPNSKIHLTASYKRLRNDNDLA